MNWADFANNLLIQNDYNEELCNLKVAFGGFNNQIEPSVFTRFNTYFVKSIEINEKKQIAFIYPNDPLFLASFIVYKSFYDLENGDTKSAFDISSINVGDMLCLGEAVFKVAEINEKSIMFYFKKGNGYEKNGRLLSMLPPLAKAQPNAKITNYNKFLDEFNKLASSNESVVNSLIRNKNLRNNTIIIVGPTKRYLDIFNNCVVGDTKLLDLINVGKMDRSFNLRPVNGNFRNYHVILCPELDLAQYIVETNEYNVESIYYDLYGKNDLTDDLSSIDDLFLDDKEVILFIPENRSINYYPLKQRNFSFFQWKKRYLLNDLFKKDNIGVSLDSFRNRSINFIKLTDTGLSERYYQLLDLKKDIEEMPPAAINAYVSFFNTIKDELTKYCYVMASEEKVMEVMKGLEAHCLNLKSLKKEVIGDHPLVKIAEETYKFIFDFLLFENEKVKYIWNVISRIEDHNEKVAIIVPDNIDEADVYKYYSLRLANSGISKLCYDVITISDFQFSKWHYKKAIFVGWFRKEVMKTAILSNNSDENVVLLYNCEIPWVRGAKKAWEESNIVNDFADINPEVEDDCAEEVFTFEIEDNSIVDDLDTTSKQQSKLFISGLLKENSDTEFVDAVPLVFSDNTYAFFPASKVVVSASLLISGDSDDLVTVPVSEIKQGDILIIKDNSSCNVLEELGNKILNDDDVLLLSKCWKEAIAQKMQQSNYSIDEMIDSIKNAGSNRHRMTIKTWITDESIISPMYLIDLKYIADATEDVILSEDYEKVFEACKKVKASRIKAGFKLSETMFNSPEIKKAIERYKEFGTLSIKNHATIHLTDIGTASVLKVIDVGEIQEFPKVLCNKRRSN